MKTFIAIVRSTAGKLEKFQDFDTQAEADAHVDEYGGWVAPKPSGNDNQYWVIDAEAKTLGYDQPKQDSDMVQKKWLSDMRVTDKAMTRQMEDLIEETGLVPTGRTKDAYDVKKTVRARKPT